MSEAPPRTLLRSNVVLPFLVISLVWGSTWVVILDQIHTVPPAWSVVSRFSLATIGALLMAVAMRSSLLISGKVHGLAMAIGLCQFCGNYMLVYHAELHLTSGIVAVMMSLLIIPNALLGSLLLGQKITGRFAVGSAVALGGIALLLANEVAAASLGRNVGLGVVLALGAMIIASIASVIQAGSIGRSVPIVSLLAWSMLYGTLYNVTIAWAVEGPPTIPAVASYWAGAAYLAFIGSVITFPLYWRLVREIGPGRAAYHGVLVVIIAMTLSTLVEGYVWSTLAISGSALSLAGLMIALRARKPAE